MYSVAVSYVLGALSFVPPFNGLLRFYLGKPATGVLYTMTAGFCWIGNIVDIAKVPMLVEEANLAYERRKGRRDQRIEDAHRPIARIQAQEAAPRNETVEKVILRLAKQNQGVTTLSEVALEADISLDEAKSSLDALVSRGFAEMRVKESGTIAYSFPDFTGTSERFEDI